MTTRASQSGIMLIESLIAMLIFSIGILALIAMYANSVAATTDAQYRIEAVNHANRILSRMWAEVDRVTLSGNNLASSLASYAYNTGGGDCEFSGGGSGDEPGSSAAQQWADGITAPTTGLPGAAASQMQILVGNGPGEFNRVTITVCWKAPGDAAYRKHVLVSNVN